MRFDDSISMSFVQCLGLHLTISHRKVCTRTFSQWCFEKTWVPGMKANRIIGQTTKSSTSKFHTSESHHWRKLQIGHQEASTDGLKRQARMMGAKAAANLSNGRPGRFRPWMCWMC